MKNENKLILELCRFINPDKKKIEALLSLPLDFPYVLGQLLYHRMGAAAYYTLRECSLTGGVNREARNTLKMVYDSGALKHASFQTALESFAGLLRENNLDLEPAKVYARSYAYKTFMFGRLVGRPPLPSLQRDGFSYAMLKGAYLASLYPAGLRVSNDLDILTDQSSLPKLEGLLKSAGFRQGSVQSGAFVPASRSEILSSRMNRGETVPFIKKVDLPQMEYFEIDINFSLDFKAKQESDAVYLLLQDAAPRIETKSGELLTLSPVDFLIHLCVHLFKEATVFAWVQMERDLSLYKFADLYLLLHEWQNDLFFDNLRDRIRILGMQRECYFSLLYTKELFGVRDGFPEKLLSEIKPESTDYLKEIIRPDQNKVYRHNKSFTDWIFTSARKTQLEEAASGAPEDPWLRKFNLLR